MTQDEMLNIVAIILIVIPIIDWATVILLWRAHQIFIRDHRPSPRTLDERGQAATVIALAATLGAGLGLTRLFHGPVPPEWMLLILATILILPSMANAAWLIRAVRGDFRPK